MSLLILTLPLLGSLSSGLLGYKIGKQGSIIITTILLFITMILGIILFINICYTQSIYHIKLFTWLNFDSFDISWGFNFDSLTVAMLLPVLIISFLVHLYSISYMENDPHISRLFAYLSMFTFFMLILITADNFLLMFVGWEGVGISSYLLVNFWFTRIQANKSAISALLTNRVGDMLLTIGLFIILSSFGNLNYHVIFPLVPYIHSTIITLIGIFLLLGAMAKSAQLGLHIWLPLAMEGPTPVSALIHAATMVTAGVYLLMRASPILEYSSTTLLLILWIGGLTSIFAATTGLFQNDLKKVIAYSTCSQLGMLFVAIGLSEYNLALFHLINHAYFKALLFLSAGSIIHAMNDNQDMRKYGGLIQFLPFSYIMLFIGSLSLMAMPFLTGFYSKDMIIESSYGLFELSGEIIYIMVVITAVFTSLYSFKAIYLTFLTNPNTNIKTYNTAHEPKLTMGLPLIILSILSIFFGYITKDLFIGYGTPLFNNVLFQHSNHVTLAETEFGLPTIYKLLPILLSIVAVIIYIITLEYYPNLAIKLTLSRNYRSITKFFNQRYYFELLYNKYFVNNTLNIGYQTNKIIDRGFIELIGPYGITQSTKYISQYLTKFDTGLVTNYALYILLGLVTFITLFIIAQTNLFIILLFALIFLMF